MNLIPDWIREEMTRALEPGPLENYARIHMPEIFEEDEEGRDMAFEASNGLQINGYGSLCGRAPDLATANDIHAARFEFYQHLRDEELGRWRWPENPDYVVYPYTFDSPRAGVRGVTVLAEEEPRVLTVWEDNLDEIYGRSNYEDVRRASREAARAYFNAHPVPEPKHWWTAKTGEIWVLTITQEDVDAIDSAWTVNNQGRFENPDSTLEFTNRRISAARRIWPEEEL